MIAKRKNPFIFPVIIGFAVLVYFIGLFVDVAGDAAKYGAIAKNIYKSGDFINLSIHGEAYDQKPPLLFWLSTLGYYLFGVGNFGFKFLPVLYSFFGVFCVYKLAAILYSERVGRIAALLISFSEIYFLYNVDVHTDMVLQANVTFALWQLYAYLKTKKTINFILGFFAIGLAVLTKGPIGAFVPAFAVIVYLLSRREFLVLLHPKWLLGILITLVTAIPAFWGLYNQFGIEGLKFFFWTNNFGRIAGTYVVSKNTDYFFYLHTLLYIYAPWGFVLFVALFLEFKDLVRKRFQDPEYFILGGVWLFFIILSIARGKSPNYILILIPLLTIILAKWLDRLFDRSNTKLFKFIAGLQIFIVVVLWCCVVLFVAYLFPFENLFFWGVILLALLLTYYIYRIETDIMLRFFAPSMLVITLLGFCLNSHILPFILQYQSSVVATHQFNKLAPEGDRLYNYDYEQFELFFYGKSEVDLIPDVDSLVNICNQPDSWIFCYEDGYQDILDLNTEIDTVYQFQHRGIYRTGIKFILPSSRAESLRKTFLVKLK